MDIYTLNVGQGQFVVVAGNNEAFVVDTYVPLNAEQDTIFVKAALAKILAGKELVGLVVTGFDADHFCEAGMKIVLNKYRPNWIMYPKYFKATKTANECFAAIRTLSGQKDIDKLSVVLDGKRHPYVDDLCEEFSFEIFSPHKEDMTSSNNCSLVCKVTENGTGATYLITGDTETDRWDSILTYFGDKLESDVLAAPHHGSENGIDENVLACVDPHTILVSAGVNNQYGHPHLAAKRMFSEYAEKWYSTHAGKGQSLHTVVTSKDIATYKFAV